MAQVTDADAIERFVRAYKTKRSPSTADRYERELRHFAEWLPEDAALTEPETVAGGDGPMGENLIERWLLEKAEADYAPDSIKVSHAAISSFYQELYDDVNPAADVHPGDWAEVKKGTKMAQESREDVVYLEPEDITAMAENAPAPRFRNGLIIRLLAQTGMRCGELCTLREDDVKTDRRRIQVRAEKTEDNRWVYYQNNLREDIGVWRDIRRDTYHKSDGSNYLFPTHRAERISKETVRKAVRTAAENAGIQSIAYTDKQGHGKAKVTTHTLRHSFAVAFVRDGGDIVRLARLMGHTKENGEPAIETTKKYLKFKEEDIADAAREHGPRV